MSFRLARTVLQLTWATCAALLLSVDASPAQAQLGMGNVTSGNGLRTGLQRPRSISGKLAGAGSGFIAVEDGEGMQRVPIDRFTYIVIHDETDLSCLRPGMRIQVDGVMNVDGGFMQAQQIRAVFCLSRNPQHSAVQNHAQHNAWWDAKPQSEVRITKQGVSVHSTLVGKISGLTPLRVAAHSRTYPVQVARSTPVAYELLVDDPRPHCSLGDNVSVRFQQPTKRNYFPAEWIDIRRSKPRDEPTDNTSNEDD